MIWSSVKNNLNYPRTTFRKKNLMIQTNLSPVFSYMILVDASNRERPSHTALRDRI